MGYLEEFDKKIELSREYFQKACDLGISESCHELAKSYYTKEPKNIEKFVELIDKECDIDALACEILGFAYWGEYKALKVGQDTNKAMNYFKRGCNLDYNRSCEILGRFYSYEEKDYSKGNKYSKKACDLGNGGACNTVGFHYENGYGYDINLQEAYKFYKKACENLKNNYGCGSLGYLYLVSKSADDFANSSEFYEKSCKFNDGDNCANLENFLKNYDFIDRDYKKAKELLKYSCDEKVAQSCGVLGTMYEFGKGVTLDKDKAKAEYKKACDLGYKFGCDELKRLEND